MAEISLGCWILGLDGSSVFQVHIARSETVDQLKEAIKEENDHALNHIAARQLKIWKVSDRRAVYPPLLMCSDTIHLQLKDPLSSRDIANTFAKIGAGDEVPNADKLDPMNKLSRYFPEPPVEEMVHLVVQLPLFGELPTIVIRALYSPLSSPMFHLATRTLSGTAISPWSSAGLGALREPTMSLTNSITYGFFARPTSKLSCCRRAFRPYSEGGPSGTIGQLP